MKWHRIERIAAAAGTVALLVAVGCGDGQNICDASARAALTVKVETGEAPVCDATVTAHDGAFSEVLMPLGSFPNCNYGGAYERAGTYTLDVVSGSHHKTVGGLVVTPGKCHVNGLSVTVLLDDVSDAGASDANTSEDASDGSDGAAADDGGENLPYGCSGATPSFTNDVVPIVRRGCAGFEICHGTFGGTADAIYTNFVNAPLVRDPCPGVLVKPGDIGHSYLMNKITGVGMCQGTVRMPLGTPLPAADIQTFADWICEGAPKN